MTTAEDNFFVSNTITVPKSSHVRERNEAYSDWTLSIFREFFQNSTDAGASRIDIDIHEAVPKGYLGRSPEAKRVTRLVFSDDAGGMSEEVLRDVYFALGQTTKKSADSIGGFGRARIMQAFANVRYSIRTQNLLVEGEGSNWKPFRMEMAPAVLSAWAERTRDLAAAAAGLEERLFLEAAAAQREADALEMQLDNRFLKGCRFEVDLNPEDGNTPRRRPTVQLMLERLEEYLSQSDLRCKVFVNGVERERPAKKREARRDIFATLDTGEVPDSWRSSSRIKLLERPDGRVDVAFGKILVSDEAGHDLVVRVSGASMFKRTVYDSPKNLVIEINPAIAREVMTSNRDGLKDPYQRAVDHFQKMMSTDARAALEKKEERQFTVLAGGRGRRTAKRPAMDFSGEFALSAGLAGDERESGGTRPAPQKRTYVSYHSWQFDDFLREGIGGVAHADFASFFDALKTAGSIEATFLAGWSDVHQSENFVTNLKRHGDAAALDVASGELLAFICDQLRDRRAQADLDESRRHADKLGDLHDVPILKEHLRPDPERLGVEKAKDRRTKLLAAIGRADPRNWDPEQGKGMKPRKILAMWQVAVDACVELLMETQPRQKPFSYAAGFCFSHPTWSYQPHTGDDGWVNALAKYWQPEGEDATRYFLLNPLRDEDFSLAFNPSGADDRADMISRAMHEVAHVVAPDSHNERFAGALTFMLGKMTPGWMRQVNRSMDAAVSAVDAVFSGARTRVQALDEHPGPRPGDVLMQCLPREIVSLKGPDGTSELDCRRLDMLDDDIVGASLSDPTIDHGLRPNF